MTMRFPLLVSLLVWLAAVVNGKKSSPFYRIETTSESSITTDVETTKRNLEHVGPRRPNNHNSLVEVDLQHQSESSASIRYDNFERRSPSDQRTLSLHNAGGTRSVGHSYASSYNHHMKEEENKYEDVSTNEDDYDDYKDNDQTGKYEKYSDDDYNYYDYGSKPSGDDDDDDGKGSGGKGYQYYSSGSSSSSYSSRSSKSSKSSKSGKSHKSSKSHKASKSHKSGGGHSKPSPKPVPIPTPAPTEYQKPPPAQKKFIRFVMVREEAGTPVPGYFGIGDSLALNGQVYYWEGVGDKVMSEVPSGNFVALCTGVTANDDLLCTYEIVLKVAKEVETSSGVGAVTAHGVNYYEENDMVVTGTEFDFAKYHGGTLVTVEDPVQPYLYATLYLI